MAKSSKRSSSKTPAGKSGKAKPDASTRDDVIDAEVVSETSAMADDAKAIDAKANKALSENPEGDDVISKASSFPEIEPVKGDVVPDTVSETSEMLPETPASDDVISKASSFPEIEPVKGDAEPVKTSELEETQEPEVAEEIAEEPKESSEAAPAPVDAPPPAKSGLFGSVLGGIIAAAIGFGAAMMFFPQGWKPQDNSALTELQNTVAAQGTAMEAATAETQANIADTQASIAATQEALEGEIAALSETDTALTAGIDGLNTRLDELTQGDGSTKLPDDVQILLNAQKEEISQLQATVAGMAEDAKAQMEAAAAQQETAEQAEARVKARGAAQEIRLALLSGEPFAEALDVVAPAVEVPAALAAVAADGAPTSAEVSGAFPAAARAALSQAVREEAGDDTQSRLKLFFQDQLNARSLSPQEGDSADAVLSRAEAAVKAEDYQTALNEIDALPETAQAALADWRAQAEARLGAVDAFTAVTDALNSN